MFVARLYGVVGVAAGIMEEVLFRILPGHLLCKAGMQWRRGVPANFPYAAVHNIIPVREEASRSVRVSERVKLRFDLVPLPPCQVGAYCW